jgi:molybdopterin converting factor small subunit
MPVIRIPTVLRPQTGRQARVEVDGATVGEALAALVADNPALEERLLEDGKVRGYVNVFVDDEDIRYLDGEATVVPAGVEISIMPAVAGGAR